MENLDIRITQIDFTPIPNENGLVGFMKIILNDCYLLEGIAVYICKDRQGYRVTYPNRKCGQKSIPIHYPTKPEISRMIETRVNEEVSKYYRELSILQIEGEED